VMKFQCATKVTRPMMDFQIKRTTRRCFETEQDLKPGQPFYSELVDDDGELCRRDYSESAWQGPGEHSIGWWKSRIPQIQGGKVYWAPRDILLSYFQSLQQHEKNAATTYVMALLLVRKRLVKLVDSIQREGGEVMEINYAKEDKTWTIPVVQLSGSQVAESQNELAQQLFMDHPPD